MKISKLIILLLVFNLTSNFCTAQIQIASTDVAGIIDASEGDYYITTDTNALYVGMQNGTLKPIGIVTNKGTAAGDVLTWNTTTNTWVVSSPTTAGLSITNTTVKSINRARIAIQPEANVNSGLVTITPSAFELNETTATLNGSNITGLDGDIKFTIQPNVTSTTLRTNLICNFLVNGTLVNSVAGALYIRADNNHNESGTNFIFNYENALPTDNFSFSFTREAETGTVALVSAGTKMSYIFLEHFNEVSVISNITAPIDLSIVTGPKGDTGPQGAQGATGSPGPVISSPTQTYQASGSIAANGTPNYIQGATVTRVSTGNYTVTLNAPHANGANYPVLFAMEQNAGIDDYIPAYVIESPTVFRIEITEQDNGASAGVFRDAGFSFYIAF